MKRRALSTIVGAVFFVIVMASTISYVTYSMDLIGNLAESITIKQDQNQNLQNEGFKITKVSIDNNEFNLTVKNTGTIPINITRMWAQNMTDSSWNQTKYQLNQIVSPGGTVSNIGIGTGLIALNSSSYSLILVTERGNSLNTQVLSTQDQPLEMTLFTTPSSPLDKQQVTLLYTVKNNLTEGSIIQSLTPQLDVTTAGTGTFTLIDGPTPATIDGLNPNESALFEWTYEVGKNNADQITFNATVANAAKGNFVEDTVTVDVAPVAESSINQALGGAVGVLQMDFASFEFCEPSAVNCETDTTNWKRAWNGTKNTKYIWRINMTNNGLQNIILDENTSLLSLKGASGGGGNINNAFFLKNNSTDTQEDGGAYDNNNCVTGDPSCKILIVNVTSTIYFGADGAGATALEATNNEAGIFAVNLLIFGHEDTNGNGLYDDGTDIAYSQNLPFQAFKLD